MEENICEVGETLKQMLFRFKIDVVHKKSTAEWWECKASSDNQQSDRIFFDVSVDMSLWISVLVVQILDMNLYE